MLDIEKFKEDFNKLLDSQENHFSNPLFAVYNQFFSNDCATTVDFSCFTLEDAKLAYEELYGCATDDDIGYNGDLLANKGNLFHEFCEMDNLLWSGLHSLPATKSNNEYF